MTRSEMWDTISRGDRREERERTDVKRSTVTLLLLPLPLQSSHHRQSAGQNVMVGISSFHPNLCSCFVLNPPHLCERVTGRT